MRYIGILQLVNKSAKGGKIWRLALLLILSIALLSSLTFCTSSKKATDNAYKLTPKEKKALKEFFRDLLFDHSGAFVLYGTKPLSLSLIEESSTDEEKARLKEYYESLSEEEKNSLSFRTKRYDFASNYQEWKKIRERFLIRQYLFGEFHLDSRTKLLLFVNIEMALRTLLKYYENFRRVLGSDFNPFEAVFEIENEDSKFWNTVLREHSLLGTLLGYGEDNAWFFEWKMKYGEIEGPIGNFIRSLPSRFDEDRDIKYPNPQNFPLPIYRSFGLHPNDKRLFEQYKKEQRQIKALYDGHDEVDVAIEWLTR